jgi:hypothetical protein
LRSAPFTLCADELDQLFDLGESIVSVVQEIDRQTHRFLLMLAEFDARRGWELGGHAGCADWLAHATGMDRGTARERVRMARALQGRPEIFAAVAAGELERLLRTRRSAEADEAQREEMRHTARSLSLVPDLDGMI